ncbi:NAD-dependent succinate-semialdehyde dehydrogenase [Nocardioides zeae]|uniref:Succinate-semialdehyde dehydrogenase/glutarate-semialdehyde dehydrogenase n=1 Tax=Nocardioides zeae TaxID=1457234 RepID=A0AAJ1U7A0_9ACTN|nr:NAD-dependent succinate-semialdehyde dehydrogenase [Nocardioides zeae]MDQ1105452.1 succinate-semialdehyde dehydrogenase/glutarate-semialdehyde dehydrogenase [Nocardioides zeae]
MTSTPQRTRLIPATVHGTIAALDPERGQHIAGRGLAAASGATFTVVDKATGERLATFADAGATEANAAVDAATEAFPAWAATPPRVRGEALHRAFELMRGRADELAAIIAAENGKSLADARGEVAYAAEFFRWNAEEAVRPAGDYGESPAGGARTIVTSHPVGVAALATPWNFPAAMATRKIGPALAAGCTVVLKPAAETPLTALAVVRILEEAGVPAGVVNVVTTTDPGSVVGTWLADDRVRKISFTGSTGIGRLLLRQAADRVVNPSMELGGNAPFVVAPDADVDAAVAGAMVAKFRNGGQACTAANCFYVHADVADAFVEKFGDAIEALHVGSAFEDGTAVGPLISAKAVASMTSLVEDALARGARISHQAPTSTLQGHFYPPTLLVDVPAGAEVVRTEVFGPVAPVVTWTDESNLLDQINDTEFGLASYVYSGDLRWALKFAERIEAGMVAINRGIVSDPAAPFGGFKQSGLGREGARDGLKAFTETQYISVDWS